MSPAVPLSRQLDATAALVQGVRAGRSLSELLPRVDAEVRAGAQALAFAAMRRMGGALVVREALAPRPPAPAVDALVLTALALLWPGDDRPYPDHTLVDQAVAATRKRLPAAAGFVNAVLRRFVREREALVAAALHKPLAAYNHPPWWVERLRHDWPAHWTALLAQADRHPPMTLRVNARRADAAAYAQRLAAQGMASTVLGRHALMLARPCPVQQLPGFAEGEVSVQDLAAQRAAPLLLGGHEEPGFPALLPALPHGARVLDACAAPGGKTAHLLELADLDLLALDADAQRLQRVHETLQRLRLPAEGGGRIELKAADARQPRTWWDGRPFDAILLDAPCTASGIVRRHPDIRWLRRADDVASLARVQAELLDALWPLLAPGGRLLYATCSIFRAEGQAQVDAFLQRQGAAGARLVEGSPGHLLPLPDNGSDTAAHDGFHYALLTQPSDTAA